MTTSIGFKTDTALIDHGKKRVVLDIDCGLAEAAWIYHG